MVITVRFSSTSAGENLKASSNLVKTTRAPLLLLEEKLAALIDPVDGQPVVTRMMRGRELFGDAVDRGAPDLVLLMRDLAYITRQGYEFGAVPGVVFQQPASFESGSHRENGIAVLAGPHFVHQAWHAPHAIVDLAPTLLHLLGVPAFTPGWMVAS